MTERVIGQASVKVFVPTGLNGSSELTGTGLPNDGSICMAFLENGSFGSFNNADRYLVVYNGMGGNSNSKQFTPSGGSTQSVYPPSGWSFAS